jgi:hypothetical protein
MRKLLIAVVALALAAPAAAGGFATVGVSPLPSADSSVWTPTLIVRAHGRTPVDGVRPVITIRREDRPSQLLEFAAEPTGARGEYSARVEFPGPGLWSFTIHDGYSQTHTFKPVRIGAAAAPAANPGRPPGGAGVEPWALAAATATLGAAVLLLLFVWRGRSPSTPASVR